MEGFMKRIILAVILIFASQNIYAKKHKVPLADGITESKFEKCMYQKVEHDAEGLFLFFDCGKEGKPRCYIPNDSKGYKQSLGEGAINGGIWGSLDFTKVALEKDETHGRIVPTQRYSDETFEGWGAGYCKFIYTKGKARFDVFKGEMKSAKNDDVDLPFVDQPEVTGLWKAVDFVDKESLFEPGKQQFKEDLSLKEIMFLKEGKTNEKFWTWTKDVLIHKADQTASAYQIKNINGTDYMFLQWKSGDYTWNHITPQYYVLERYIKPTKNEAKGCKFKTLEEDADGLSIVFNCKDDGVTKCYVQKDKAGFDKVKSGDIWKSIPKNNLMITKSPKFGRNGNTTKSNGIVERWFTGDCIDFYFDTNAYSVINGKIIDKKIDNIDLKLENDAAVIGKWKAVAFVPTIEEFKANKITTDPLFLKQITFQKGGKISVSPTMYSSWTKGVVIDKHNLTASTYTTKNIEGKDYMFLEWKSGDYTFRHEKPKYYVLEKVVKTPVKATKK